MNRKCLAILVATAGFGLTIASANAQATRTWVSGVGNDANPCSRTAPCATFAGTISKTAAGGEIDCLDPGGFGAVTITKSITIDCGGMAGGVLATGGVNGIIVNAGANDRVVLRNMGIQGVGTGFAGIRYLAGAYLVVENVTIDGFTSAAIDVNRTGSGFISIRNLSTSNVPRGIKLFTSGSPANLTAQINLSHISAGTAGLEVASVNVKASITNSVITDASYALYTSGPGFINADNNIIARNIFGVNSSSGGGSIRISRNAFQDNSDAITYSNGGTVSTSGSNTVIGGPGLAPNGGAIPPL